MKAFSHINIGEKISFIIGCKNYRILVVSKKTDKPCANCTRTCAICTSFNLALQALGTRYNKVLLGGPVFKNVDHSAVCCLSTGGEVP